VSLGLDARSIRQQDAKEEREALNWLEIWTLPFIGSALGQGSEPLWCSWSDERESSWHTGGLLSLWALKGF